MIEWLRQIGFKHLILFINSCTVLCGAMQDPRMRTTLCLVWNLIFFPSTVFTCLMFASSVLFTIYINYGPST